MGTMVVEASNSPFGCFVFTKYESATVVSVSAKVSDLYLLPFLNPKFDNIFAK